MATITFFLTVAVVGILLKPELYESKTTVIKENDSMQSEVDEKNIESEVSNQEEWGSGDVYDGSSPIIRKMGEKLSVIGQHRTIAEASAVESPIRQETIGFPAHFFARAHNFKPPGRACQPEADSPMRT